MPSPLPTHPLGPAENDIVEQLAAALQIDRDEIIAAEWVDNGPGWVAAQLASAEAVLAVRPAYADLDIGLVGAYPPGSPEAIEVRAFFPKDGVLVEDPVTAASTPPRPVADADRSGDRAVHRGAGSALGRAGRVHVTLDDTGQVWIGGDAVTCVEGEIEL